MWGLWRGGCQGLGPGPTPGHTRPPPRPSVGTASTWARPPGGCGPPSRCQLQNNAGPLRSPWGMMSVRRVRRQTPDGRGELGFHRSLWSISSEEVWGGDRKGPQLWEMALGAAWGWRAAEKPSAQKGGEVGGDSQGPGQARAWAPPREGARNALQSAALGTDTVVLRSSISQ